MTALLRQNTLFIAEDWIRIYEALENVDFRAYDFDNLVSALMNYIKLNYPDDFNDWIASSEMIMKVEILAWLSQNIAFRVDLNTRENFLATAERRDSLIRLAQLVAYKVGRVRGASGMVKVHSIRTTQALTDSNGATLQERVIRWNDPKNEDWYEQFITVMNAAFSVRTKFGRPLTSVSTEGVRTDQYVFRSMAPSSGTYKFSASINGVSLPFDLYNARLDETSGAIRELSPNTRNAQNVFYLLDQKGFGSSRTGFFFPLKQGSLTFEDHNFTDPVVLRTVILSQSNVNNDDLFVQRIDQTGTVLEDWTQVDTVFGEGVSFNTEEVEGNRIYEVETLSQDRIRVRFGDGAFGIPVGRFRFWFRTSNPTPMVIKPNMIQNQTVTIPYAVDTTIYYLTLTYSLLDQMDNAGGSEMNFDIRTRANKWFYTQNRMITGQDYNNFILSDNSIVKVKTINRTYSGHSRYTKLNDPTGLFQNIKHIAEDGRLYQDGTRTVNLVSANTDIVTINSLVNDHIRPLIRKEDKRLLYYSRYLEIGFPNPYEWVETSILDNQSRGNITRNGVTQQVGQAATNRLRYVGADSLLRYSSPKGPLVSVDRVVENGTATDGVILRSEIPNGATLVSVFPPLRNRFLNSEILQLNAALEQRLDFGISWNQTTQTWNFITFDNLNKTGEFSLSGQGDESSGHLDGSWMILMEFVPNGNEDLWRITDRGMGLFFESAREVDFIVTNPDRIVDPETGEPVRDQVLLLESNESRDSLRRRRLQPFGEDRCNLNAYQFIGDGVTTCFQTSETLLNSSTVVIVNGTYRANQVDYLISPSATGDSVCFYVAPAPGEVIEIRISYRFVNAQVNISVFDGDGTTDEFNLGAEIVVPNNIISFIDGVMQYSSLDFGVGQIGNNASIVYNEVLGAGTRAFAYHLSGVDSFILAKYLFRADGFQNQFDIPLTQQTHDTLLISLDGVVQAPELYSVVETPNGSRVEFVEAPPNETRIRVIAITEPLMAKTKMVSYTTDGFTNSFEIPGISKVAPENVMVFLDGVAQEGAWGSLGTWTITGNHFVLFNAPPVSDLSLVIFVLGGASGFLSTRPVPPGLPDNQGNIDVSSCFVSFLGVDVPLDIVEQIRHPDGYTNPNGVFVLPADEDQSGFYDNPLVFRDLVIQDGFTDLVLWRRVEEYGFDVWDPINSTTSPKGTYGLSTQGYPRAGDQFDPDEVADGDIHYDQITNTWMVADQITSTWVADPDQTRYRFRIGRDHLKFLWVHYAPDAHRIDPSVSNIMNAYILTASYDSAFRTWIVTNGPEQDRPQAPDSESLRLQYAKYDDFKAESDALIYSSALYKPLFGNQAIPELRATFKLVQTRGSLVSEADLKLRVLRAINEFFNVSLWDFGEKFYFTELCTYIHRELAPDLQTVVIVPRDNNEAFGRMFEVRAEPNELFISSAQPDHIEVVPALTDEELRIGVFV